VIDDAVDIHDAELHCAPLHPLDRPDLRCSNLLSSNVRGITCEKRVTP
jgi:hypothetical protein